MSVVSIFQANVFDYNPDDDVYTQEVSYIKHSLNTSGVGSAITIKGDEDRHYRLEKVDRSGGDIAGWWYYEIGGTGKVLIIND